MWRYAGYIGKIRQARGALLALSLGLIVTTSLWFLIRRHEERDLHWATRIAAESLRADLIADLDYEIGGLLRLSMVAERVDSAEQFWKENVYLYTHRRPGCIAVERLTPDYRKASLVYAPDVQQNGPLASGGSPLGLLKAAAEYGKPIIGSSAAVEGAGWQRVTVVPIGGRGEPGGFLAAFFDVARAFDYMLADAKGLGFSLIITDRGQEIYRMFGDSKEKVPQPRSTETAEIKVPDVTWDLRVWPQPATLYALDAKLPELTLILGSLISLLVGSTVYFASSATAQSRNLRQLNLKLTEQIRQREQAEEELHRAHEELEARVRLRTMELSAANAKLEREVEEHARAEEALRNLTGQLFQLQDEERRRLARELHDGATQNLVALAMNMAGMRKRGLSAEERAELLDDSVRLIQESVGELRTTSHLLHPPLLDELGLPVTLRSYVEGFSARSGICVNLTLDPQLSRLNRDVELGIFRVVQESLSNVHRHSRSETANVLLRQEHEHVRLEISDEGTGIPPEVLSRSNYGIAGVGIAGMQERVRLLGGHFEVDSDNTGTTIRILLPLMETIQ